MKQWTMVRLTTRTRDRLTAFLASQVALQDQGRMVLPESGRPGGGDPSVDWLVNLLLDRVMAKRRRAKKQRAKKRGWSAEELLDQGVAAELPAIAANHPGAGSLANVNRPK